MKKYLLLMAVVFALVVTNTREARAQVQDEAPGHVDETLPDSVKAPALFLYGFYAAYLNISCYCDGLQLHDNFLKAVLSKKLRKVQKERWSYDILLDANNITYLTIPTLKVVPMGNHWYEVSYQWPWNDREIIKIPVKVVQDGRDFKIINIISHGEYLLPEKQ